MNAVGEQQTAVAYDMTRSRWMAQEGSRIYGTYYDMLVEQSPPKAFVSSEYIGPDESLIYLGRKSASYLIDKSIDTPAEQYLLSNTAELLHYTDVESIRVEGDSPIKVAIRNHARDGLEFAHAMTMGIVNATVNASRLHISSIHDAYLAAGAILSNPATEKVIRVFALTGFAVIGSDAAPWVGGHRNSSSLRFVLAKLELPDVEKPIRLTEDVQTIDDLSSVDITIEPIVGDTLRRRLNHQNRTIQAKGSDPERKSEYYIENSNQGKRGFSSGCPVAHNKYTFPTMQRFLYDSSRLTLAAMD